MPLPGSWSFPLVDPPYAPVSETGTTSAGRLTTFDWPNSPLREGRFGGVNPDGSNRSSRNVFNTTITLDQARQRFRVNDQARRFATDPDFSRRIRSTSK